MSVTTTAFAHCNAQWVLLETATCCRKQLMRAVKAMSYKCSVELRGTTELAIILCGVVTMSDPIHITNSHFFTIEIFIGGYIIYIYYLLTLHKLLNLFSQWPLIHFLLMD